jgi:hypothetical protein
MAGVLLYPFRLSISPAPIAYGPVNESNGRTEAADRAPETVSMLAAGGLLLLILANVPLSLAPFSLVFML